MLRGLGKEIENVDVREKFVNCGLKNFVLHH